MNVRILSVSRSLPEFFIDKESLKDAQARLYGTEPKKVRRLHRIVESTGIEGRFTVAPIEYLMTPRPLEETEKTHLDAAIPLAQEAAIEALERAGVRPDEVDLLVVTSCTGVPIPGVDADLVNLLGMRPDVVRLPFVQLGCAGGAIGLARAADILRGIGGGVALTIAVELPTLTFQRDDPSMANLVASTIFGDGAAAVVLSTSEGPGLTLERSKAHHFPNSRELMGFSMRSSGFHIVLDKSVPAAIEAEFPDVLVAFLAESGLTVADLDFHALHPGGTKILKALETALELDNGGAWAARKVLREVGNLSSATVLFVLQEILEAGVSPGSRGLLAAFGPGFSAEMQTWVMR